MYIHVYEVCQCKYSVSVPLPPGVIPGRRGEVWSLLIQLYQERCPALAPPSPPSHSLTLSQLCQKSTDHENSIKMDLGKITVRLRVLHADFYLETFKLGVVIKMKSCDR